MLTQKVIESINLYKKFLKETQKYKDDLKKFNRNTVIEKRVEDLHNIIATTKNDLLPSIDNFVENGKVAFERFGDFLKKIAKGIIKDTSNEPMYREIRVRLTRYIGDESSSN
jgi:hypothetical protein